MPAKPGYLILAGIGGIFLWSGIQGKSVTGVVRALIGGHDPGTAAAANQITPPVPGAGILGFGATGTGNISGVPPSGASGGGTPTANQALARMLAVSLGHPDWAIGQQWSDWVSLWNQESGWNQNALNPTSGATGIPQLLPSAHPVPANWSSPAVQVTWGINYIAGRYGSPSAAWQHEQANNWY